MVGSSGLDLITAVAERHPTVQTILVTGLLAPDLERRVRDAGGFAVVEKPVDIQALCELVRRAFLERGGR